MASSDSLDPANPITSISTEDVMSQAAASADLAAGVTTDGGSPAMQAVSARDDDAALESGGDRGAEQDVWEGGYAFGNFAGRLSIALLLLAGLGVLAYYYYFLNYVTFHPLVVLVGIGVAGFWLWFVFRVVRARMGHHYRLTTNRLFVSSGIFRRTQDMMELDQLKEVSVKQGNMLDHLLKLGTVVVTSTVQGSPTLFLLGIKYPQRVTDLIYHHARDKSA